MFEWIINWGLMIIVMLLASLITSVLGQYLIYFRMMSFVGGISHFMVGGIGLGVFLGVEPELGMLFFFFHVSFYLFSYFFLVLSFLLSLPS